MSVKLGKAYEKDDELMGGGSGSRAKSVGIINGLNRAFVAQTRHERDLITCIIFYLPLCVPR
jgi:hypothetical protein